MKFKREHFCCSPKLLSNIAEISEIEEADPQISKRLSLKQMDLLADPWPFGEHTIGGVVLVDFLDRSLFQLFERCLIPGGYLLIETISNRGGNYLELPRTGELHRLCVSQRQLGSEHSERAAHVQHHRRNG